MILAFHLPAIAALRRWQAGLRGVIVILLILWGMVFSSTVLARVTPEDIVNSKKEAYETIVKNYSSDHQQKLEALSEKIAQVNKIRNNQLGTIMDAQASILNEYEKRQGGQHAEQIKKARYWITFAHEAVAYQAAKVYIFELSNEQNLRRDVLSTINLFQNELNSTRNKVINSQKTLLEVVKVK